MARELIIRLGAEGGSVTIYGIQTDGIWSFQSESSSIDIDDDDNEVWLHRSSDPTDNFEELLPGYWPILFPLEIHPDFVSRFRAIYESACMRLEDDRYGTQIRRRHREWLQIFDNNGRSLR